MLYSKIVFIFHKDNNNMILLECVIERLKKKLPEKSFFYLIIYKQ